MADNGVIHQSLKPASQRLYESSKCLASGFNSHEESEYLDHSSNGTSQQRAAAEKPTLAAMARHYRLGQLLKVIAPLVILQERLYRRLEKQPHIDGKARKTFPNLFQTLEDESKTILQVALSFSVEKESRFIMETNINLITDSLNEILDAFRAVQESQYDSPGCLNNKMAETVNELRVDWNTLQAIRGDLPERYVVDYGTKLEKTSL